MRVHKNKLFKLRERLKIMNKNIILTDNSINYMRCYILLKQLL